MKLLRRLLVVLIAAGVAILLFLPADLMAAPLPGLDDTCLDTELRGCSVMSSGYLATNQGPRIAFQTQAGFTDADGVKGGVVLFAETASGWTSFARAFDGYRYDTPRLVEHELTLLHVPGYTGGSGTYNADLLFVWNATGASWQPIALDGWLVTIGELLPAGLEIWQGVDYDFDDWFYDQIDARTPLWRDHDGNCCPSGGWATIHFAIEDNALVATSVDYQPPAKTK